MCCPKQPIFEALHHTMLYLSHHPDIPIMYPRNTSNNNILCQFPKGESEIVNIDQNTLLSYNNADLTRDLQDQQSVTSTIHTLNSVADAWE